MLWLQTPPWGRWIATGLIVLGALWVELRPEPTVEHPFATEDIAAGAEIGEWNRRLQPVPDGMLEPVILDGVALTDIALGEPILASTVGDRDEKIPDGWWAIEIALPGSVRPGDRAEMVLLDTGSVVPAVVVAGVTDDPLGSGLGSVAVSGEHAAEVAAAAVNGRVAVMIATR
ncbi:MAG: hypothetical protein WEE53_10810 [Acidimicrobiia bacterium]